MVICVCWQVVIDVDSSMCLQGDLAMSEANSGTTIMPSLCQAGQGQLEAAATPLKSAYEILSFYDSSHANPRFSRTSPGLLQSYRSYRESTASSSWPQRKPTMPFELPGIVVATTIQASNILKLLASKSRVSFAQCWIGAGFMSQRLIPLI